MAKYGVQAHSARVASGVASGGCYSGLLLEVASGGAAGSGVCAAQSPFIHRLSGADYFSLGSLAVPGEVRAPEPGAGVGEQGSRRAEQGRRRDPGNLMLRADVVVGCPLRGGPAAPLRGATGREEARGGGAGQVCRPGRGDGLAPPAKAPSARPLDGERADGHSAPAGAVRGRRWRTPGPPRHWSFR